MTDPPSVARTPASVRKRPRPSDAREVIIALDTDGKATPVGKLEAHQRNIRHRAVSVFVFRNRQLLLQQRAADKYHSPLLWANTCCSHPRWNESPEACADRRLLEEMGFNVDLEPFGIVEYQAPVGDLFENEVVHRFHGQLGQDGPSILPNPDEVAATAWMSLEDIVIDIASNPVRYAPWFCIYMREHLDELQEIARDS